MEVHNNSIRKCICKYVIFCKYRYQVMKLRIKSADNLAKKDFFGLRYTALTVLSASYDFF